MQLLVTVPGGAETGVDLAFPEHLVLQVGKAQVQGVVSGCAVLRQAVYFSPQGYYMDMLYDVTLLENPFTAQPLWLASARRKEAACVR